MAAGLFAVADMVEQASKYTKDVAILGVVAGLVVLAYYISRSSSPPAAAAAVEELTSPERSVDKEEALQHK
jgi:hypothetical protein